MEYYRSVGTALRVEPSEDVIAENEYIEQMGRDAFGQERRSALNQFLGHTEYGLPASSAETWTLEQLLEIPGWRRTPAQMRALEQYMVEMNQKRQAMKYVRDGSTSNVMVDSDEENDEMDGEDTVTKGGDGKDKENVSSVGVEKKKEEEEGIDIYTA